MSVILISTTLFISGCNSNYNYCNINTDNYTKGYKDSPIYDYPIVDINLETIKQIEYIQLQDNLITFNNQNLNIYNISNISNYTLLFNSDAIIKLNGDIKNTNGVCIISTSKLIICGSGGIYSNSTTTLNETEYNHTITGNNIEIIGDIKISSNDRGIKCNQLDIYNNLNITTINENINCNIINIYGNSTTLNNEIYCELFNIYGGHLMQNSPNNGIFCNIFNIYNGFLNIICQNTAIRCNTISKTNGFLNLFSNIGIISQSLTINYGHLYAKCKESVFRIVNNLTINGGTNIVIATNTNTSAIDAENIQYKVTNGIIICISDYLCIPQNTPTLATKFSRGDVLSLNNQNWAYDCNKNGSLYVSGNFNFSSFSLSAKIVDYSDCFYGFLLNPKINTYSNININTNKTIYNFGTNIYNLVQTNNEKQLF